MIKENIWSKQEQDNLDQDIKQKVSFEWERAMNDPYPTKESLLDNVFK